MSTWWPGSNTFLPAGRTRNRGLPSRFLPSPKSPQSASKPDVTFSPGCNAGNATASREWPTVLRLPLSLTISAAPSLPLTLPRLRPKCGDTDRDIYRIFMTGLDGTPMPSFADNIKPDEAWDLVFYLRTFMAQPSREKEMAKKMDLKPVDPNAPPPAAPGPTVKAEMASHTYSALNQQGESQ